MQAIKIFRIFSGNINLLFFEIRWGSMKLIIIITKQSLPLPPRSGTSLIRPNRHHSMDKVKTFSKPLVNQQKFGAKSLVVERHSSVTSIRSPNRPAAATNAAV
nr:hypothetical protein Iba_chr12eCG16220 [Ipomoea batatas]